MTLRFFTVKELLDLALPDLPTTKAGVYDRIRKQRWEQRLRGGQGGKAGGTKEYAPPPDVQALIRTRLLARSFEHFRQTVAAGDPLTTAKRMFLEEYNKHGPAADYVDGVDSIDDEGLEAALRHPLPGRNQSVQWTEEQRARFLSDKVGMVQTGERAGALAARVEESIPVAESAIRVALTAERTDWMRRLAEETRARVALGAYRVIALMSEGDERQLQSWTGSPEALRGALRMAYESDCFKRGIEPGSDMLPLPTGLTD